MFFQKKCGDDRVESDRSGLLLSSEQSFSQFQSSRFLLSLNDSLRIIVVLVQKVFNFNGFQILNVATAQMPIFLVVNFAEHFPEGHVPVFTANHFASNVSLLEHSIVRNHNRHYMQALSLGGGHALVRIQDPTNRLVRLSLLAELSTPHSLFILENYCQSTVFDDLF